MSRIPALFAGLIWFWIATSALIAPAAAFEMEGLIDAALASSIAPGAIRDTALARDELPDRWNCGTEAGVERIRDVSLCPVMGPAAPLDKAITPAIRYRILVERGLEAEADNFVAGVTRILNAPTGWARAGVRFVHVHEGYDLTVLLAKPASIDQLCQPLQTRSWLSCAIAGRAMINAKRWREGAETWRADIAGYHHYLINHEVGHLLGMSHATCPKPGQPAPIMLPQTKFLGGCIANGMATRRDLAMLRRVMPRFARSASRRRVAEAAKVARTARLAARRRQRLVVAAAAASNVPLPIAAPRRRLTRVASASTRIDTVPLPVRRRVRAIAAPSRTVRRATITRAAKSRQLRQIATRKLRTRSRKVSPPWRGRAWSLGRISKRKTRTVNRKRIRPSAMPKSRRIRKRRPKSSSRRRPIKRVQRQAQRQVQAKRWRSKWFKGPR